MATHKGAIGSYAIIHYPLHYSMQIVVKGEIKELQVYMWDEQCYLAVCDH